MFDFDLNGTLTIDEMILIMLNTIKSLSIMTGTYKDDFPSKSKLIKASKRIFKQVDIDHSESLSVEEIRLWIEKKIPFIDFL